MRTLAGWCVRHRRIVLLLWLAVLVAVDRLGASRSARDYSNNFNFPHTQSFDAINLLKSVAPGHRATPSRSSSAPRAAPA